MFRVDLGPHAEKFLHKLDAKERERIETRLKRLADDPVPSDSKFIGRDERGQRVFRYRIGDYRATYNIREDANAVIIILIDKRERVYQ